MRSLISAETQEVPQLIRDLEPYRRWSNPLLRQTVATSEQARERLHASLALSVEDPQQLEYLASELLSADAEDVRVIVQFLAPAK